MILAELLQQVDELPPEEQYEVASRALARAEQSPVPQADVDAAWSAAFHRRIDDIQSGRVRLVDHAETVRVARAYVAERRATH